MKSDEILRWRQEVHDARMLSFQLQAMDLPDTVDVMELPSPERTIWPGGKSIDELLAVNPKDRA